MFELEGPMAPAQLLPQPRDSGTASAIACADGVKENDCVLGELGKPGAELAGDLLRDVHPVYVEEIDGAISKRGHVVDTGTLSQAREAAIERVVVSARTAGAADERKGITLFLVDPKARGVTLTRIPSIDWRQRFVVKLDNVAVDDAERLGETDLAAEALERTLDWATVGISAAMLGAMNEAFRMTVEYLKARKQFGVPIGSFQALKHRAADQYVQTELARSAVYYAAMALDERMEDAALAVSTAKARCNDAFHLIANESIQMHGGIGMTDEHDIGFFFKRARADEVTLGDSTYHRDRYARLKGY